MTASSNVSLDHPTFVISSSHGRSLCILDASPTFLTLKMSPISTLICGSSLPNSWVSSPPSNCVETSQNRTLKSTCDETRIRGTWSSENLAEGMLVRMLGLAFPPPRGRRAARSLDRSNW